MSIALHSGSLRFVRHATRYPDPKWYFGADLGQRRDFSALAVLELSWQPRGHCPVSFAYQFEPTLRVRNLTRFPKGISYESLYNILRDRLRNYAPLRENEPSRCRQLIIDASGPGPPLVDRLRANLTGHNVTLRPVILTGGRGGQSLQGGYTSVPRRNLITCLQLLMAVRSLRCARDLEGVEALRDELLELQAGDTHPSSATTHDDLAIATALAAWAAIADVPELLPESPEESVPSYSSLAAPLF